MAETKKKRTADLVFEMALPHAEALGLRVWDVQYTKIGPDWHLCVYIDKQGGVSINDCEALSVALDEQINSLEINDFIFEVSSPGLRRTLRTDAQLQSFVGSPISVHFNAPDESGNKSYAGVLKSFDSENITIALPDEEKTYNRKKLSGIILEDDDIELFREDN